MSFVSNSAMKMFAKATAILVPMASFILSVLFMMTVVVPLSAFFRFNAELCFSSAIALNSFRDRLYSGLIV